MAGCFFSFVENWYKGLFQPASSLPFQHPEGEIAGVLFVRFMRLSGNFVPFRFIYLREKYIAFHFQIYLGEVEFVPIRQALLVNISAADDEDLIFVIAFGYFEGLIEGVRHDAPGGRKKGIAGDDDVGSFGQRPADGQKVFAAHDDVVAGGGSFKKLEVLRKVPRNLVVLSDDVVAGCGYDGGYGHDFGVAAEVIMLAVLH